MTVPRWNNTLNQPFSFGIKNIQLFKKGNSSSALKKKNISKFYCDHKPFPFKDFIACFVFSDARVSIWKMKLVGSKALYAVFWLSGIL